MDNRDWQCMYRQENDARLAAEARAERAEQDAVKAEEKAAALLTKIENMRARAEEAESAWESALAQRDEARQEAAFRLDRERTIIEACERVADGGQYRADIVSAIERIRRERDEARAHAYAAERDAVEAEARCAALIAERDEARAALASRDAARIAYASEFATGPDGEPDVGSIHENIRKLKACLATEPARIAAAVEARDVAWVLDVVREVSHDAASTILARTLNVSVSSAESIIFASYRRAPDDIAAAIRAARGAR